MTDHGIPQWEYLYLQPVINEKYRMQRWINRLGAEGWELVTMATDKGLSITAANIVLRRPVLAPAPPVQSGAEWLPDPTGRFDKRYWDGRFWTVHVARTADKTTHEDPPTMLAPPELDAESHA